MTDTIPKLAVRTSKGAGKCVLWLHDWDAWQEPQRDYKYSSWFMGMSTTTDKTPFFYQRRYCLRCMIMGTRKVK